MEATSPFRTENNDFCVEVEDDESNLLNSNAAKVKDQNSRLLEVYKKTQSNCKLNIKHLLCNIYIIFIFSTSWCKCFT